MKALKAQLRDSWRAGDVAAFARFLEPGGLAFLERLGVPAGARLLDVGCGSGALAIAAARAGAIATGIDIADNRIAAARERVRAAACSASFDVGDAEGMPYADGAFDVVVSLMGAMFAPRPERATAEMVRVCRPGGRIIMANWRRGGHMGQLLRLLEKYAPPPPLMPSPVLWGEEDVARARLRDGTDQLHMSLQRFPLHFPYTAEEVVELTVNGYAPAAAVMRVLDAQQQQALRVELYRLWLANNTAGDGPISVDAEYLEVSAERSGARSPATNGSA